MPDTRNLAYLIKRTRQQIGILDPQDLRVVDGYAASAGQYPDNTLNIVDILNAKLGSWRRTGFNKCFFDLPLEPEDTIQEGMAIYLMPRQAHDIEDAYLQGPGGSRVYPLQRVTRAEISQYNDQSPQWMRVRAQRSYVYCMIGTRAIQFYPAPQGTGFVATFLADTVVPDMVLPTDIPGQLLTSDIPPQLIESVLPEGLHEFLANGAAATICGILGGDENWKRAADNRAEWDMATKDLLQMVNGRVPGQSEPLRIRTPRRDHKGIGRRGGRYPIGVRGPMWGS